MFLANADSRSSQQQCQQQRSLSSFLGIFPLSSLSIGFWISPVAAISPSLVHACFQDHTPSVSVCYKRCQLEPTCPSCQRHCSFTEDSNTCTARHDVDIDITQVLMVYAIALLSFLGSVIRQSQLRVCAQAACTICETHKTLYPTLCPTRFPLDCRTQAQ